MVEFDGQTDREKSDCSSGFNIRYRGLANNPCYNLQKQKIVLLTS